VSRHRLIRSAGCAEASGRPAAAIRRLRLSGVVSPARRRRHVFSLAALGLFELVAGVRRSAKRGDALEIELWCAAAHGIAQGKKQRLDLRIPRERLRVRLVVHRWRRSRSCRHSCATSATNTAAAAPTASMVTSKVLSPFRGTPLHQCKCLKPPVLAPAVEVRAGESLTTAGSRRPKRSNQAALSAKTDPLRIQADSAPRVTGPSAGPSAGHGLLATTTRAGLRGPLGRTPDGGVVPRRPRPPGNSTLAAQHHAGGASA
jgi:hypothetical protein